jgi:FHS family L-fucose permease-like MFS transporter
MENNQQKTPLSFYSLITVFFFWGFVAASNGILIPMFKQKFTLSQFQSQLIDLAFYAAYFVGSVIYFIVSLLKNDPIQKLGYKRALITGLLISSIGALGFIPAAKMESYSLFMLALFTIGLGFALQQIVANPFVINFGDKSTGAHRLNLAGGINSFGTTIGPALLGYALFGGVEAKSENSDLNAVIVPALILFGLFVLCAIILQVSKLPEMQNNEETVKEIGAFKFPQLTFGMIAIFTYVGVEVTIQSNMGALLKMPEIKGIDHTQIGPFISLYWGCLMIGRWTGAIEVFKLSKVMNILMKLIVPLLAYAVILGVNYLVGKKIEDYLFYLPFIVLASILFIVGGDNPSKSLVLLSVAAIGMLLLGIFGTGNFALYSIMSCGLFCSVMWPCIFALAINGLGKYTNQGSSFLVMMILGGAVIPPLQGYLVDALNPQLSYLVGVICFAYLAWYGLIVKKFYKQQGISLSDKPLSTH